MTTTARSPFRISVVLIVAIMVVVSGVWVWLGGKNDEHSRLTAVFDNASPIVAGNKVQMFGVQVGAIDSIKLIGGKAHVDIELGPGAPPLHRDARATIRPVSLLGERYIDLDAGTDSAPLMAGQQMIPATRTSTAVDLDQVLSTLDDPTSTALAALVATLGEGLRGRGADAASALKALEPAMRQTGQLSDILNQHNSVLQRLVESAKKGLSAVADKNGSTLDKLVGSAETTLSTVAANRRALETSLQELPNTLVNAKKQLSNLAGVADSAVPTLRQMRPVTDNLPDITSELHRFSEAADPALASLPKVLDRLNGMLNQARPVVRQLGPASADLRSIGNSVRPIGTTLLDHQAGEPSQLENLMTGMANWAMATSGHDGIAHYYRGVVVLNKETIKTLVAGAVPTTSTQGDPKTDTSSRPQGTAEGPTQLDVRAALHGRPGGGSAQHSPDPLSVTGLSAQQEQGLLEELLGGGA